MGRSKTSPKFKSAGHRASRQKPSIPSHLYLKGNFYYFRFSFNSELRKRLGYSELRLNLGTGRIRQAKNLAGPLYLHLKNLLGSPEMLDHKEIKRRLNRYLQLMLEAEQNDFSPAETYENLSEGIGFSFTPAVISKAYARMSDLALKGGIEAMYPNAAHILYRLYQDGVFELDEILKEENKFKFVKAFHQMLQTYHTILAKRDEGDYTFENKIVMEDFGLLPAEELAEDHTLPQPQLQYSEALELYISRQMDEKKWKEKSLPDHRNRLENFLKIIGDKPLCDIKRGEMVSLRDTLRQLPPRWSRDAKFKGKTPAEIIASSPEKQLNVKTINEIIRATGSFLNWCVREGRLERNPAEGLQIKDDRPARDLKEAFSTEDLIKIVSHPKFAEGKFIKMAYYWIPVIALYTGMRLEEIAQLQCSDIYEKDGVWVIDVNERTDNPATATKVTKSLKTKSATRWVPIHPTLSEIGLLKYHQKIAGESNKRLFPEVNITPNVSDYGAQPGKQFSSVVKKVLEDSAKKSFHSLRHTFADFYRSIGLMDSHFDEVFGHDHSTLAAKQYGGRTPPKILFDRIISKLDYGQEVVNILKRSPFSKQFQP